jgi:hypothetical protein
MARQTLYKSSAQQTEPWPPERPGDGLLSLEPSKEVYKGACLRIADALLPLDFKYLRSKQRCVRKAGLFREEIYFQSSHYNTSGRHVQLWMHATVASDTLKEWRTKHLPAEMCSDHVAGGMVHRLGTSFALVQWELADPEDRDKTIADAVQFIREHVLTYFAMFDHPESLVTALAQREIPAFDLIPSVEFAYCFGCKASAQAVLDRFIRDRTDLQSAIDAEQSNPNPATLTSPGGYVQQVVFLRARYGLA